MKKLTLQVEATALQFTGDNADEFIAYMRKYLCKRYPGQYTARVDNLWKCLYICVTTDDETEQLFALNVGDWLVTHQHPLVASDMAVFTSILSNAELTLYQED